MRVTANNRSLEPKLIRLPCLRSFFTELLRTGRSNWRPFSKHSTLSQSGYLSLFRITLILLHYSIVDLPCLICDTHARRSGTAPDYLRTPSIFRVNSTSCDA